MECREYIERLAAFLESDLDEAAAKDLALHASECRPCSDARLEDGLVRRIRDCLDRSEAPPELRSRILERIGEASASATRHPDDRAKP